jgi:hypothetical protein
MECSARGMRVGSVMTDFLMIFILLALKRASRCVLLIVDYKGGLPRPYSTTDDLGDYGITCK